MLRVELSRLDLAAASPLRRSPPRPPEHRHPGYEEQFDDLTILYDCFTAPDGRLVCIGPPVLNLRPAVVPAIERAFRKSFFSWRDVRDRDRHMQMWLKPRTPAGAIEGGLFEQRTLAIQPNHCDLFCGRRVLMTKSKDNELIWIRDWVLFHAMNHGCDAVLFYDNNSTKYGVAQVHQAISSVPGIEVVVVVSWPFKYGPNAGPSGIWDSDFAQYAVLEHARHRFLAKAGTVTSADIDELVVTSGGQSVYDLAGRSRTGYLRYAGVMIENVTDRDLAGPRRHAHFAYRKSPPRQATPKWTVVPARCDARSQWCVHDVTDMTPDEDASGAVTHRHFSPITTGWKYPQMLLPPGRPEVGHQIDEELFAAMRCFAGDEQRQCTGT